MPNPADPNSFSPSLPIGTRTILRPDEVEYRTYTTHGVRVVIINFAASVPRITIYGEISTSRVPVTLSLDEVLLYVQDARNRNEGLS